MKTVKFASIVMGKGYDHSKHAAVLNSEYSKAAFFGVASIEEACSLSESLCAGGYQCIELCGAFGEQGARRVIEATGHKVAVGYSVHFPEQDGLFDEAFGQ